MYEFNLLTWHANSTREGEDIGLFITLEHKKTKRFFLHILIGLFIKLSSNVSTTICDLHCIIILDVHAFINNCLISLNP